jgi:uncharacterized membrane protein HdeD (DUF308 family)
MIRGLFAMVVGFTTMAWQGIRLENLALSFGGYAMIDGLLGIAGAVRAAESHQRWMPLVVEGLTGIAAALITFLWAGSSALSLMYAIAGWALFTGFFEILAGLRLRDYVSGEWLLVLSGVASLLLGVLVIALPLAGTLEIAFWLEVYALLFGGLLIALAFRLRAWVGGGSHGRFAVTR